MHQGIGLDVFNAMPMRKAVHALYECCYSVPLAADLARGRPYADHDALFRQADALLFALAEDVDRLDPAGLPRRRPTAGQREVAGRAVRGLGRRPEVMDQLAVGVAALLRPVRLRLRDVRQRLHAHRTCSPR